MVTREGNGLSRESLDGDILFFFFLIYWVTMVNKIIKVSNVQFYSVSSAHCVVLTAQRQISIRHHMFDPLDPRPT